MRWQHDFSYLAAFLAVLSLFVAMTGALDLPMTAAEETPPASTGRFLDSSDTEGAEFTAPRIAPPSDEAVVAVSGPGNQPLPFLPEHCPMNLGLSVTCPDVLSSAVLATSVPGPPGRIPSSAEAAGQPDGALPEAPGAPILPVSLIRLSISRV
ncbi:hypothetical protein [Arthrobacter sp. CG_A4]|uniref:hypothetical protein n=1 Tax=Arthrobacter sp. CG_A4 TaxID=3071706 RepID=UPI002E091C1B|nr:hypothetical protein [Arthrobacter sp. CG_A4]